MGAYLCDPEKTTRAIVDLCKTKDPASVQIANQWAQRNQEAIRALRSRCVAEGRKQAKGDDAAFDQFMAAVDRANEETVQRKKDEIASSPDECRSILSGMAAGEADLWKFLDDVGQKAP